MSMILYTVLSLSITGSVLALLLFALKPVYKRGFSKVWQYYIWLIVLARLLVPFSPETNLFNMVFKDAPSFAYEEQPVLVPPTEQAADADADDEENARPNAIPQDVVEPESVDVPSNPSVSFTAQDWLMYAGYLWAAGALGLFIWKLSSYLRLVRQLQRGSKFCSDPRVASYMDAICASMKISPAPVVYISEAVPTPMLIGIWRQSMILPNDALGKDDLKHVLQHELVHYRRYDILYKWLAQIAVCVHWFNPLVYLVRREISRNCELACDEVIIRGADDQERKDYGEAIIEAIKPGTASLAHSGISVSMSEDTKIIKERLDAIMKYKNTPKIVALLSIFMAAIIMCGAAFAGSFTGANVDGSTNTPQVARLDNTHSKDTESAASTPEANSKTVLYNGEAVSGLNIEANSIGLEIIKTTGDAFTFEYLNVDNEDLVSASASMGQNSVLDIRVINSGTLSYTNSDPGNYRNVVRINVPEASYSQVTMNLEQAPTTMQDLSSNINITGNRGGVEIKSATISGNYTINNASGGVEFTANEILGNITVTNNGEVIVTLASQPTNLSLDATGSSGEIILPSGWSRTHTIGNGAPSIVINNRGFTEFSIAAGANTVSYQSTGVSTLTKTLDANLILNSTDAALINEQEWSVDDIASIEATYATDRVSILPSTNGNVVLREYLSQNSASYHATTEIIEGTLKIRLGSRPAESYVSRIEIYVPESMIGSVKASTTSGKIEVNGYSGSLDITTTSGKIEVLNGSIDGNISSSSGAVEISLSGLEGNLQAVSSSGKVTAYLPQTIAFSLSATSNSGKVINNFSDTFATAAKSVTGSWGTNPSNTINLQSSTSTVTINVN